MENQDTVRKFFMQTLRFASLSIVHAKHFVMDYRWHFNYLYNAVEIYLIRKGKMHIVMNDRNYTVDKNKMVLIPANVHRESYVEKKDTVEFYVLQFISEAGT